MVNFEKHVLENGLTVVIHQDTNTPLATINLLYKVGSRDESPDKTGFAHLFEHLMFGGSKNAESFDDIIQLAGGDSNAYTNADITNFYCTLPAINLDTALWLEADRMRYLNVNQKSLSTQQQVVTEEYKETCINQPYGLVWHMLSDLCYKVHPYRWPTIGKQIEHIAEAKLEDVQQFYNSFYGPNNAILSIAGPMLPSEVLELVKLRFGSIPARPVDRRTRDEEPMQTDARTLVDEGKYPSSVLYLAWLMDGRNGDDYYAFDLLSDVMSLGRSSIFYQRMVKVLKVCAHMDAYITGSEDKGLFIMELRPSKEVTMEEMEAHLWNELAAIQKEEIQLSILEKLKNKNESTVCFSNVSASHKATNLGYYESLGDANLINTEADRIAEITAADIFRVVNMLRKDNVNTMRLISNGINEGDGALVLQHEDEEDDEDE
ncbi:MAG: insulinase family protein [Saprospiraceae bacterium]|nr:insulinase family protein [Candidatus Opimibacter skivensis]